MIEKRKHPYYFTVSDESPFVFAGLWEIWNGENESGYRSCTIITTDASESVIPVHHRMSVILKPECYDPWLDTKLQDAAEIQNIFQTGMVTELSFRPVSQQVNSVRNNRPENIEGI